MEDRAGELWNLRRLQDQEEALEALLTFNPNAWTISGGYAWHLMSPRGHIEEKRLHDHKDLDVFVRPALFPTVLPTLKKLGFVKARTLHDDPSGNFVRYTRFKEAASSSSTSTSRKSQVSPSARDHRHTASLNPDTYSASMTKPTAPAIASLSLKPRN